MSSFEFWKGVTVERVLLTKLTTIGNVSIIPTKRQELWTGQVKITVSFQITIFGVQKPLPKITTFSKHTRSNIGENNLFVNGLSQTQNKDI